MCGTMSCVILAWQAYHGIPLSVSCISISIIQLSFKLFVSRVYGYPVQTRIQDAMNNILSPGEQLNKFQAESGIKNFGIGRILKIISCQKFLIFLSCETGWILDPFSFHVTQSGLTLLLNLQMSPRKEFLVGSLFQVPIAEPIRQWLQTSPGLSQILYQHSLVHTLPLPTSVTSCETKKTGKDG